MTELSGGCHCGKLQLSLQTRRAPAEMPLRICGCSFCRRHGARYTSDPAGRLRIRAQRDAELMRYRFGSRNADFLVCGRCGTYLGAVARDGDRHLGVVNVNVLAQAGEIGGEPGETPYEGEDTTQRMARWRANWTPVEIISGPE